MRVEPARLRGRDVRVDLDGVAEVEDQLPVEVPERTPGAVQTLQDDRRPRRELGEHAVGVRPDRHLRAEAAGRRVGGGRQDGPLHRHPDEGGAECAIGEELVDGVGGEQVVEAALQLGSGVSRALLPQIRRRTGPRVRRCTG